jgi:hypothetical protein
MTVAPPPAEPRMAATAPLWQARDWLVFLALAVLTAISRWPFRTRMIYAWDGGLFAQALRDYNVVPHHPQPPGYIFYVGVGKLIQLVTGWGPNAILVAISIGAASLTVGCLYLLGTIIFDRPTGLLAAGLGLTSVSFWLFSELAYPYTVLALGSTVLAIVCWLLANRRFPHPPLAALAFGLISGFRQDLLPFLGPLFAVCYLRACGFPIRRDWRTLLAGLAAGAVGIAAWWIATDLASEGWGSLWRALTIQSANIERGTSAFATGETGLRGNGTLLVWFSKDALHLAAFPALAYLALWPLAPRREGWRPPFLVLWAAPAALFYLLVHIGEAGYVFSFLPAVLIMAGAGLTRAAGALAENLPRGGGRGAAPRVGIALALAALILPYHTWLFAGSGRLVSAERLGCKDAAIAEAVATLARDYPPATTELVTSTYLQHIAVYLPQFRNVRFLDPDRDAAWTPAPGIARVAVFDLELVQRFDHFERWSIAPLACGGRYGLAAVPAAGARFTFDARRFALEVAR